MAPIWQVREHQRQILLDSIISEIYRVEGNWIFSDLAIYTLQYVEMYANLAAPHGEAHLNPALDDFFSQKILFPITKFARTKQETCFILVKIAKKLVESVDTHHTGNLNRQELREPEKIYGTKDRMAEVDMP